jgi:CHASE3 domain sensor protein
VTVVRFLRADKWVTHNYDVRLALGDLQSAISAAARARTSFLDSGDDSNLASYSASKTEAHEKLVQVRDLTKDNPAQQALSNWLEDNALRRLELLDTSIELPKSGPLDEATQLRLSHENIDAATDVMDVTEKMDDEEERLLDQR